LQIHELVLFTEIAFLFEASSGVSLLASRGTSSTLSSSATFRASWFAILSSLGLCSSS
jgi:hypothetical protein